MKRLSLAEIEVAWPGALVWFDQQCKRLHPHEVRFYERTTTEAERIANPVAQLKIELVATATVPRIRRKRVVEDASTGDAREVKMSIIRGEPRTEVWDPAMTLWRSWTETLLAQPYTCGEAVIDVYDPEFEVGEAIGRRKFNGQIVPIDVFDGATVEPIGLVVGMRELRPRRRLELWTVRVAVWPHGERILREAGIKWTAPESDVVVGCVHLGRTTACACGWSP